MTTDKPEPYEVMMRRAQESMREIASAHAAKVEGTALIGELRLWASLIGTQPRGARELFSRAADALEAQSASASTPPADDVREAFTKGWYSARQNPGIAAATHSPDFPGEVRPRGTVTDTERLEYTIGAVSYNGTISSLSGESTVVREDLKADLELYRLEQERAGCDPDVIVIAQRPIPKWVRP